MTDKEIISGLEKRIEQLSADTTLVNYYKAMKKQVDNISKLMLTMKMDEQSLTDKDDKFFDRYKFFVEKSLTISENLKKMEELIAPIIKKKSNIKEGSTVEKYIFRSED